MHNVMHYSESVGEYSTLQKYSTKSTTPHMTAAIDNVLLEENEMIIIIILLKW